MATATTVRRWQRTINSAYDACRKLIACAGHCLNTCVLCAGYTAIDNTHYPLSTLLAAVGPQSP